MPTSIRKDVKDLIELTKFDEEVTYADGTSKSGKSIKQKSQSHDTSTVHTDQVGDEPHEAPNRVALPDISPEDLYNQIEKVNQDMRDAAKRLEFERAAMLRDQLSVLRQQWAYMYEAKDSRIHKPSKRRKAPKKE